MICDVRSPFARVHAHTQTHAHQLRIRLKSLTESTQTIFKWVAMHLCFFAVHFAPTNTTVQPASRVKCKCIVHLILCSVLAAVNVWRRCTNYLMRIYCPCPAVAVHNWFFHSFDDKIIILHTQSASHQVRWLLPTGMVNEWVCVAISEAML